MPKRAADPTSPRACFDAFTGCAALAVAIIEQAVVDACRVDVNPRDRATARAFLADPTGPLSFWSAVAGARPSVVAIAAAMVIRNPSSCRRQRWNGETRATAHREPANGEPDAAVQRHSANHRGTGRHPDRRTSRAASTADTLPDAPA
jgi:hypothetical protein